MPRRRRRSAARGCLLTSAALLGVLLTAVLPVTGNPAAEPRDSHTVFLPLFPRAAEETTATPTAPATGTPDATATARAILANEPLFRAGLAADLVMLACYVGVTTLFLDMFRPVHAGVSRMAAAFSLIGIAVLAADTLLLLVPLRLLATTPYLAVLGAPQREAATLLALKVHGDGYDVFRHLLLDAGLAGVAQRLLA